MIKLKFMNNDSAHLVPECEAELFRGVDWEKGDGITFDDEPNKIWKRLATAQGVKLIKEIIPFTGMDVEFVEMLHSPLHSTTNGHRSPFSVRFSSS